MKRVPVANFPAMLLTVVLIAVSPIPLCAYASDAPDVAVAELVVPAVDEEAAADEGALSLDVADESSLPADGASDVLEPVDVDGSGWLVEPLGDLAPQASALSVEDALTVELAEGQAVTFVGELSYPAPEDYVSPTEPVSADLLFPAGDVVAGDALTVVFYAEGDEPVTLEAPVVADADGNATGVLVEVRFDGARLTLNGVSTGTANGRYEVIGAIAPDPAEPDEQDLDDEPDPEPRGGDEGEPGEEPEVDPGAKLEEELAAAMAELEELRAKLDAAVVLDEDELPEAADTTAYLPADDAAALASALDAIAEKLAAEDLVLDDITAARGDIEALHEELDAAIATVQVDRTALNDAIATADTKLTATASSEDGRDVKHGSAWTKPAAHDALVAAIAEAKSVRDAKDASQNGADRAADALAKALVTFEDAVEVAQVSRTDLEKARAAAADVDHGVTIASDIFDVAPGAHWAPTAQGDALNAARTAAKGVADADLASLTQSDVDAAAADLNKAANEFTKVIATKPSIKDFSIVLPKDSFGDAVAYASPDHPLGLKSVFEPAESAVAVTWSTSDSKTASVDANGTVSAVSDGVATITATTRAFPGVAESVVATRRIAVFGTGATWDYKNADAGIAVEGVPSGLTVEYQVFGDVYKDPVTDLGKGDRAVIGIVLALVTPLDDTVAGVTFDNMHARLGIRTHDYDGQTVEVVLYGDDGRTYTYETVASGGEVYLTIPTGGYFEVIAPIVGTDGVPAREQLPQTGDSSLVAIAAVGGAGIIAVIAGVVLALKKRRS